MLTPRDFARQLRQRQTHCERLLWQRLRARQLQGLKFRRQFPVDCYVLDFYCSEAKLAVELDGGQHYEPTAIARDQNRTVYLSNKGMTLLRFTNLQILHETDSVLQAIADQALVPTCSQ